MPFYFSDSNNLNFYSKVNGFNPPFEYLTKTNVVTDGLVLNFDAAESKTFSENYVSYSTYNSSTWSDPLSGSTFATGIDAPDGTNTAVRFTCNNITNSLLRVSFPSFTPNGTDLYTISFYVRKISGSGNAKTDLSDSSPNVSYSSQLITNEWVRVVATGIPTASPKNFIDLFGDARSDYILDFWGVQVEKGMTATDYTPTSGTRILRDINLIDLSGNGNNGTRVNGVSYNSGNGGSLVFDGVDDSVNFTYDLRQNFTYECWVLHTVISGFVFLGQGTTTPSNGLHIWFRDTNNLRFGMYSNDTDALSLTTSTGIWYHYCFTYNHTTFLKQIYRNGTQLTGTPQQTQIQYTGTGTVRIGASYSSGGDYANGRIASSKLYNRVLTQQEIQQNFDALRQRFGI